MHLLRLMLVWLAAASAACERAPLSPDAPSPVAPRAAAFAQTFSIGSTDSFGGIEPTNTGIRVPSPRWVRLRATGTVQVEGNPTLMDGNSDFCKRYGYLCFPWLAGRTVGPEGVAPCAGCVPTLNVFLSAGPALYHRTIWTDADAVVFLHPEWPVVVGRTGYRETTRVEGLLFPTYVFGGGELTVEAQEIEPPFTLAVSDTVFRPFDSITATLQGDQADAAIESFMFVRGDTAAEPQSWGTDPRFTPEYIFCRSATCPVYPQEAGRIYAVVRPLNQSGHVASGFIAGPVLRPASRRTAKLALACTSRLGVNRVTRGDTHTCTARKEPPSTAGSLKVSGWSFEDRPRADGDPASTSWRGVMAQDGVVTVRGVIGAGAPDSAKARITVVARAWTAPTLPDPVVAFAGCAEVIPRVCPLQYPPIYMRDIGRLVAPPQTSYTRLHVNTGPNTGYNFIDGDNFFLRYPAATVFLNEILRSPGDPYFRDGRYRARRECVVSQWLQEVREHELTHHRLLRDGLSTGQLASRWEGDVFFGPDREAGKHYRDRWRETAQELRDYGDYEHDDASQFPRQDPDCYDGLLRNPPNPLP